MQPPSPPLVQVRQLSYTYADGTLALDNINFDMSAGETVVLLGANGSGKTTFVLHLNGLLLGPGHVTVGGVVVRKETLTEVRRRVGVVFQNSDEQLFMSSVLEDVAFGPQNLGIPPSQAYAVAQQMLERVGLPDAGHKVPYHLSSGEKKRVAIAGVLAMQPDVLILDEPTVYLDPPGQRTLIGLLRELPQPKIIVTHDMVLARAVGTRAVFFSKGRIAGEGKVASVIEEFQWDASDDQPIGPSACAPPV